MAEELVWQCLGNHQGRKDRLSEELETANTRYTETEELGVWLAHPHQAALHIYSAGSEAFWQDNAPLDSQPEVPMGGPTSEPLQVEHNPPSEQQRQGTLVLAPI